MGTNYRLPDEGPQHKVTLKAFELDKYEVTNLQYEQFVKATKRRSPIHFRNRTFPEGKADHPVINVTWEDARVILEEGSGSLLQGNQSPDDMIDILRRKLSGGGPAGP